MICVCIAEDSFKRLGFQFITHLDGMLILVIKALRLTVVLVLAVLHWLVDHHRCSSEVSSGGGISSCLSHLWSHRYSGLSHVRHTLQTVSVTGNVRFFITGFGCLLLLNPKPPSSGLFSAYGVSHLS